MFSLPSPNGSTQRTFVNQGAHRLAQEYDPRGERTIGMSTGTILMRNKEQWSLLRCSHQTGSYPPDRRKELASFHSRRAGGHSSWFCVKCLNTQAISSGVTWERAREDESSFFSQTAPWSTLNSESKQKLGTGNLTSHLSEKLCERSNCRKHIFLTIRGSVIKD
jgi:hypothetical protein